MTYLTTATWLISNSVPDVSSTYPSPRHVEIRLISISVCRSGDSLLKTISCPASHPPRLSHSLSVCLSLSLCGTGWDDPGDNLGEVQGPREGAQVLFSPQWLPVACTWAGPSRTVSASHSVWTFIDVIVWYSIWCLTDKTSKCFYTACIVHNLLCYATTSVQLNACANPVLISTEDRKKC